MNLKGKRNVWEMESLQRLLQSRDWTSEVVGGEGGGMCSFFLLLQMQYPSAMFGQPI